MTYSVKDLAEMFNMPEGEVRSLARNRALTGEKKGTMWFLDPSAADELGELVNDNEDDDEDLDDAEYADEDSVDADEDDDLDDDDDGDDDDGDDDDDLDDEDDDEDD